MTAKPVFHGSDIEKICDFYGLKKEEIVKFGANVNPLGVSEKVKREITEHIDIVSSYPDRDYVSLREVISGYCNIPASYILPGNGSSELISLFIETRRPKKTMILGPTYSEYSRELSLSGSEQQYYHLKESDDFKVDTADLCRVLGKGYDFLILCNPNNPTSSAIESHAMEKILKFCEEKNIFVMIDETYVEFVPEIDKITAVPLTAVYSNLAVLRGVSKFFAAPGLRLGYAVTGNAEFLHKIKEKQIPWSLSSIAAFAGERMLQDHAYIKKTRDLILSERQRMFEAVNNIPAYKAYQPYANFILLQIKKEGLSSYDVFEACIRKGLMIRDCSSFQCLEGEYVRFCIMMPEDNTRLLEVLRECGKGQKEC